jgi:hypothetical protein
VRSFSLLNFSKIKTEEMKATERPVRLLWHQCAHAAYLKVWRIIGECGHVGRSVMCISKNVGLCSYIDT